jgi:hypothetical protein
MTVLKGLSRFGFVILTPVLLGAAPTAIAEDCTLAIKTDGAVRCLERKIAKLEKLLEQSQKSNVVMPKDAIVEFQADKCPAGWVAFKTEFIAAGLPSGANTSVRCLKN